MLKILNTTLSHFYEVHNMLLDDLLQNKITYSEAKERYKIMCDILPSDVFVNPAELNIVMKKKFKNEPTWNSDIRIVPNIVGIIHPTQKKSFIEKWFRCNKK